MSTSFLRGALLGAACLLITACASSGGSSANAPAAQPQAAPPEPRASKDAPPPASHKFAQVTLGMSGADVKKILGEPDNEKMYPTAKRFIPYMNLGGDTERVEYYYRGSGRIQFTRNQYSGNIKVIRIIYNPADPGF